MELPSFVHTVVVPLAVSAAGAGFCLGVLYLRRLGRELRTKGVTARATVVRKFRKPGESWLENFYAVFSFVDGQHRHQQVDVKVPSRAWRGLAEGETTAITYLPDHPERAGLGPVWGRKLVGAFLLYIALVGAAVAVLGLGLPLWDSFQSTDPGNPFAVILIVGLFAGAVPALLILSRRQNARRRAAMTRFAAERGWTYLDRDAAPLLSLLKAFSPDEAWSVYNVVRAEGAPGPLYLFEYQSSVRGRRSDSLGFACLAEAAGRYDEVVTVYTRIPLVEKLITGKQEVGEPEFRRKYVVLCDRLDVARAAVTPGIQKVLLEHAAGPGWVVEVRIGRPGVMAMSSHAVGPAQWEHLVHLAQPVRSG